MSFHCAFRHFAHVEDDGSHRGLAAPLNKTGHSVKPAGGDDAEPEADALSDADGRRGASSSDGPSIALSA